MKFRALFLISLFLLGGVVSAVAQQKIVLGKLGQTTKATKIYAAPNTRARVYYRAKPFEYVVLQPNRQGNWYRVLLQNMTYGYISAEKVAELPYQVTTTAPNRSRNSRGTPRAVASGGSAAAIAQYSLNYIGTPYVWGGNDERRGIDCSGFVKNMFGRIGVNLPRTAAQQALVGKPITRLEDLQPGDRLYFWENRRNKIGHTGIYLGNGHFVHSSSGRRGVATDDLRNPKWLRILVAARR